LAIGWPFLQVYPSQSGLLCNGFSFYWASVLLASCAVYSSFLVVFIALFECLGKKNWHTLESWSDRRFWYSVIWSTARIWIYLSIFSCCCCCRPINQNWSNKKEKKNKKAISWSKLGIWSLDWDASEYRFSGHCLVINYLKYFFYIFFPFLYLTWFYFTEEKKKESGNNFLFVSLFSVLFLFYLLIDFWTNCCLISWFPAAAAATDRSSPAVGQYFYPFVQFQESLSLFSFSFSFSFSLSFLFDWLVLFDFVLLVLSFLLHCETLSALLCVFWLWNETKPNEKEKRNKNARTAAEKEKLHRVVGVRLELSNDWMAILRGSLWRHQLGSIRNAELIALRHFSRVDSFSFRAGLSRKELLNE